MLCTDDPCNGVTCMNDGTCLLTSDADRTPKCSCAPRYTGNDCSEKGIEIKKNKEII